MLGVNVPHPGGRRGLSTEARAITAALTTTPTATRRLAIDRLVQGLKAAGLWSKIAALQDLTAENTADFFIDLKTPSRSKGTTTATVTRTAGQDFKGDGSTGHQKTALIPSTHLSGLSQNSFCIFVWSNYGPTGGHLAGARNGAGTTRLSMAVGGGSITAWVNNLTAGSWTQALPTSANNGYGLAAAQHSAAGTRQMFFDGVQVGADNTAQTAQTLVDREIYAGGINSSATLLNATTHPLSLIGYSQALSAAEHVSLNSLITRYMQDLGSNVNWRMPTANWGDSVTVGPGLGNSYPDQVAIQSDPYRKWHNAGVSGENMAQIHARMLADTTYRDRLQMIQGGYNGLKGIATGASASTITTAVNVELASMASCVALANERSGGHYMVIGSHNGDSSTGTGAPLDQDEWAPNGSVYKAIIEYNAALLSRYGSRYIDIRGPLMVAGDGSANDSTDIANGVVPRSKRADYYHLNAAGTLVYATAVYNALAANGY